MPRARRSQVVKLTQAKKRRGKAVKEGFLDTLADHLAAKAGLARSTPTPPTCPSMVDVDHVPMEVQASPSAVPYDHIYVIHIEGLRTSILQALRERIKPESKMFFGKQRLMALALQRHVASCAEAGVVLDLSPLINALSGKHVALVFSVLPPRAFEALCLEASTEASYARKGSIATRTIILPEGPLMRNDEVLPHTMERALREAGLPVVLKKGLLCLDAPFTICQEEDVLDVNQAELLRMFFILLQPFSITCLAHAAL